MNYIVAWASACSGTCRGSRDKWSGPRYKVARRAGPCPNQGENQSPSHKSSSISPAVLGSLIKHAPIKGRTGGGSAVREPTTCSYHSITLPSCRNINDINYYYYRIVVYDSSRFTIGSPIPDRIQPLPTAFAPYLRPGRDEQLLGWSYRLYNINVCAGAERVG